MEKIYFETYGCSLNYADTETMMGLLKEEGYQITNNLDDANLIIINTCTVKGPTDNKFKKRLKKLPKKPTIIAGCLPQAQYGKFKELKEYSLIGPHQLKRIGEVVEETLNNNQVILLAEDKHDNLTMPHMRRNKIIEIIPICSGCKGNCTYCITRKARGKLQSYSPELIIERAQKAIAEGVKEIWITSQDNGAYGLDIGTTLPELLKKLIQIPGDYKIRLGMANPNFILKYVDELIPIFKDEKMFKFLHIPVQSGNDEVLKNMNRKYHAKDWIEIVEKFRKEIPKITIATDIICGFPGETEKQFRDTIYLIEKYEPDVVNRSKFWKRPGTPAAKMKQTPGAEIKKRSSWLSNSFRWVSFQKNKKWINWTGEILVDEKGKDNTWIGRNDSYKQVIIQGNYSLGQKVKVKIINSTIFDLRAIEIK
jgi:MiaB-like tRNA modifying enzyme